MRKTRFVLFLVLIGLATIHCPKTPPKNVSPVASLIALPSSGAAPLQVFFDASGSYDPDGDIDSLIFDFGDGQQFRGLATKVDHIYSDGNYFARVIVRDREGAADTAAAQISAQSSSGVNRDEMDSSLVWWMPDNVWLTYTGDGWLEVRSQTSEDSYLRSGTYDLANLNRFAIFLWPGHDFHIGFAANENNAVRFYANGNPPQLKAVTVLGGKESVVDLQSPVSLSSPIGLEFEFLDSQINLNVSDDGNTWVKAHEVLVDEVVFQKVSFSIGVFDTPSLGHAVVDWTEISYGQASAMRRRAIWDANTEPDLAGYRIELAAGDTSYHIVTANFFDFIQKEPQVAIRVQAFDLSNNYSLHSARAISIK